MPKQNSKQRKDERKYHPYNLAEKCDSKQQPAIEIEIGQLTGIVHEMSIQTPHSKTLISETLIKHSSIYKSVNQQQPSLPLSLKLPTKQDSQGFYVCD